jgi:CheY-like chemotaxis protein
VEDLKKDSRTASIPILVVTAKRITDEDRTQLSGHVTAIMEKGEFDSDRLLTEVRRAMSGRQVLIRNE